MNKELLKKLIETIKASALGQYYSDEKIKELELNYQDAADERIENAIALVKSQAAKYEASLKNSAAEEAALYDQISAILTKVQKEKKEHLKQAEAEEVKQESKAIEELENLLKL